MNVTIGALQAYLSDRYGGWASEQEELGTELADMIHYIVAIAAINNIDLNDTILRKDKAASVKYHHEINLETFLSDMT